MVWRCGCITLKALLEERDAHNASRGGPKSFHDLVVEVQAAVRCIVPIVSQVMLEVQAQMGEYAQLRGA